MNKSLYQAKIDHMDELIKNAKENKRLVQVEALNNHKKEFIKFHKIFFNQTYEGEENGQMD